MSWHEWVDGVHCQSLSKVSDEQFNSSAMAMCTDEEEAEEADLSLNLGRLESVPVFVEQNLWQSFEMPSSMSSSKCCCHLWHIRVPRGAPRRGIQWHNVITMGTQTGDIVVLYHVIPCHQVIKVHTSDGFMIPETSMLLVWIVHNEKNRRAGDLCALNN